MIPRILHRVVPAEPVAEADAYWQRFAALHPGWVLKTHRDPLDPADWPLTSPHWDRVTAGAQLAGLVRLEALWWSGGIYVDHDVEPFRSFESLLHCSAFAAWEDASVVPDAVLGAEPRHAAIAACLRLAIERLDAGPWESGPGVTTEVLPAWSDVLLLPPGSFYPVHYRDAQRDRRMRDFRLEDSPWAFGLHHYWGSWLEPARRRVPRQAVPA